MVEVDNICCTNDLKDKSNEKLAELQQQAWDLSEDYRDKFELINRELNRRFK